MRALFVTTALALAAFGASAQEPPTNVPAGETLDAIGSPETPDLAAPEPIAVRQAGERLPFAPPLEPLGGQEDETRDTFGEGEFFGQPPEPVTPALVPTDLLGLPAAPRPTVQEAAAPWEGDQEPGDVLAGPLEDTPVEDAAAPADLLPQKVETTALSAKELARIGTVSVEDLGFAAGLWRNTGYSEMMSALNGAQTSPASPVIHTTLRQLALAIDEMPQVSERGAWNLLKARMDLLERAGDVAGLHALAARLPNDLAPLDVLDMKARAALYVDDWPMACAAASEAISRRQSRLWTGLRMACHAGQGNRGAVDLLYDTTDPANLPSSAVRNAVQQLLDKTDPIIGAEGKARKAAELGKNPSPLLLALNRMNGMIAAGSGEEVSALPPALQASLAAVAGSSLEERWPAVAAIAVAGRLDGRDMLQYAIGAPISTASDPSFGLAPGQLQRALSANNPVIMTRQLLALSQESRSAGVPQIWAGAAGLALKDVAPVDILWPRGGAIAAHVAYAGWGEVAAQWYDDVRAKSQPDDLDAARAVIDIWPWALAANPAGRVPFTPRVAGLWLETSGRNGAGQPKQQAKVFFAVLEGLGYDLGAELRVEVDAGLLPLPAALPSMDSAVANGQVGLAILAGFKALGPNGAASTEPATLRAVIAGLRAIDQAGLARALAVEAMFHAGMAMSDGR